MKEVKSNYPVVILLLFGAKITLKIVLKDLLKFNRIFGHSKLLSKTVGNFLQKQFKNNFLTIKFRYNILHRYLHVGNLYSYI